MPIVRRCFTGIPAFMLIAGVLMIILLLPAPGSTLPAAASNHQTTAVLHTAPHNGPVTIRSLTIFDDVGEHPRDGFSLASIGLENDETRAVLSVAMAQASAGWFGDVWGFQLTSDVGIIPPSLTPQTGSHFLSDTSFYTLRSHQPIPGNVYETTLAYDPNSGAAAVSIIDVTDDDIVFSRNLDLLPLGDAITAATKPSDDANFGRITYVSVDDHLLPVTPLWWIMQRQTPEQPYFVEWHLDRRRSTVFSANRPWKSLPMNYSLSLINDEGEELFSLSYADEDEFLGLTIDQIEAGPYLAVLSHTDQAGRTFPVDQRPITIGKIEIDLPHVQAVIHDEDTISLSGTIRIRSDGPIQNASVGLDVETIARQFDWDALTSQGVFKDNRTERETVLPPVAIPDLTTTGEANIDFTTFVPTVELAGVDASRVLWRFDTYPFSHPESLYRRENPIIAWIDMPGSEVDLSGFLRHETIQQFPLAPGVTITQLSGYLPEGPIDLYVATVDLSEQCVVVDALVGSHYTAPDTSRWPRSHVSAMVDASGAIVGVNSAFFDIGDTMKPLGMLVQSGHILKSGEPGFEPAVGITADTRAFIGRWHWQGTLHSGNQSFVLEALNPLEIKSRISLFAPPTTRTPGTIGRENGVELVIRQTSPAPYGEEDFRSVHDTAVVTGVIRDIRQGQGSIPLEPGMIVLSAAERQGSGLLRNLSVGDEIAIHQRLSGPAEWPGLSDPNDLRAVISGNVILLRDGTYGDPAVLRDQARHPRTAVAVSRDQKTLYLLLADGRSTKSIGMTFREMADFFMHIGAFHALNVDGGGSSTMAIREPGQPKVTVINNPSDVGQRYVPDGIGVFCR